MTKDEIYNTIEAVKEWGREREINNPTRQLNKTIEEVGELAHEICRDHFDSQEFRDSIGDVLVTVILLADMTGNDPMECLAEALKEISHRTGVTSNGMFIKSL